MLSFHSSIVKGEIAVALDSAQLPPEVTWVDALRPDAIESAFLARVLGVEVPTLASLSEIESSSRLRAEKDWIYLNIPMIHRPVGFMPILTPLGFALSKSRLLTVHFKPLKSFDDCKSQLAKHPEPLGAAGVLAVLLDEIVDHAADLLEGAGSEIDSLSEEIFGVQNNHHKPHRPREDGEQLRVVMRKVGRIGALTSKIEDHLLGIGRMIPYITTNASYLESDLRAKLKSLKRDIDSLNDYETHLTDKIHFLLDATLGLTNIEQNNIFRILTVVSVVGIPPTFFASMWGMNFKNIHEYDWTYGYQFGLAVIILSGLIPFIWFKWRGWW